MPLRGKKERGTMTAPMPTGPRMTPPQFDGIEDETERRVGKQKVFKDAVGTPGPAADALELGAKDGLAENTLGRKDKKARKGY